MVNMNVGTNAINSRSRDRSAASVLWFCFFGRQDSQHMTVLKGGGGNDGGLHILLAQTLAEDRQTHMYIYSLYATTGELFQPCERR